ncbi:hypothetical protein QC762_202900 [Podospora pseudocomata]|uniref:Uncharacterized protein n=1 Tax=Podospora pseudocomata TaxID=2093779 RepID=A0ABR0GQH5_9PEZI|nr:hypothetical protein QC762_202900 [Podospora pseudocomata]
MPSTAARLALAALVTVTTSPLAANALLGTPGSPCEKHCSNQQDHTARDEIVCDRGSIGKTAAGIVWENCINCQLRSNYTSGTMSDQAALLYNLRFAMDTCLWHSGDSTPCTGSTACGPLEDAVEFRRNDTSGRTPHGFCDLWEENFIPRCSPCLVGEQRGRGLFLNNYLWILEAACEQKPDPGYTIAIQGEVFGENTVTIVPPETTLVGVPTPDYGPVSLGARVGIAFGGIALLLVLAGFFIVCNGKRRRRAFLRELEKRHAQANHRYGGGGGDMFETPVSQRPLRGWENESPVSAATEATERTLPRYISPYTSTYNSPVSGPGGSATVAANWPSLSPQQMHSQRLDQLLQQQSPAHGSPPPAFTQWPSVGQEKMVMQTYTQHEKRQNEIAIGLALGGDEASLRSKPSNGTMNNDRYGYPVEDKGKQRDEVYELKEVESPYNGQGGEGMVHGSNNPYYQMPSPPQAPVLHHPGYGRAHGSRPGSGDKGATGLGLQSVPVS